MWLDRSIGFSSSHNPHPSCGHPANPIVCWCWCKGAGGLKSRGRGVVKAGTAPKLVHVESVPGWTSDSIRRAEKGNLERDEEKYNLCCGCELRGSFIKGNITHTYFTAAAPLGYSPFHSKWRSEVQSLRIQQMVSQARRQTAEDLTVLQWNTGVHQGFRAGSPLKKIKKKSSDNLQHREWNPNISRLKMLNSTVESSHLGQSPRVKNYRKCKNSKYAGMQTSHTYSSAAIKHVLNIIFFS